MIQPNKVAESLVVREDLRKRLTSARKLVKIQRNPPKVKHLRVSGEAIRAEDVYAWMFTIYSL